MHTEKGDDSTEYYEADATKASICRLQKAASNATARQSPRPWLRTYLSMQSSHLNGLPGDARNGLEASCCTDRCHSMPSMLRHSCAQSSRPRPILFPGNQTSKWQRQPFRQLRVPVLYFAVSSRPNLRSAPFTFQPYFEALRSRRFGVSRLQLL